MLKHYISCLFVICIAISILSIVLPVTFLGDSFKKIKKYVLNIRLIK